MEFSPWGLKILFKKKPNQTKKTPLLILFCCLLGYTSLVVIFFFFFSKHRSFSKQRLSFRAMFLFLELKSVMGLTVSLEKSVSRGMPETSQNSIPHEVQEEHAQTLSLALSVHFSDTFLCCEKEFWRKWIFKNSVFIFYFCTTVTLRLFAVVVHAVALSFTLKCRYSFCPEEVIALLFVH